jgi:CubicO group peptidase (beta-lactamase class C family)
LTEIVLAAGLSAALFQAPAPPLERGGPALSEAEVDRTVRAALAAHAVPGIGLALIENGQVVLTKAYGLRSVETKAPLRTDTVMYAASTTKAAFAYMVMQLVDEKRIDLDRSIADYLPKPLPAYDKYADLAGDERWRKLTFRILLDHTTGFANFRDLGPSGLNPDGKLRFYFDPGARYGYSGEGINLAQFVLEAGLGFDVGAEMQRRVFDRFAMRRTSMTWRADFAPNVATGYDAAGKAEPHHQRGSVRAAGSMDSTVDDFARFVAGLVRGEGLSERARAEMLRPQIAIESAHQFPTLRTETNPANREIGLAAGLGVVVFQSPAGPAFYKGGHDDWTDNVFVCLQRRQRCVLLYSNSGAGAAAYPAIIDTLLGDTHFPYFWESGLTIRQADAFTWRAGAVPLPPPRRRVPSGSRRLAS